MLDVATELYNEEKDKRCSRLLLVGSTTAAAGADASHAAQRFYNQLVAEAEALHERVTGGVFIVNNKSGTVVVSLIEATSTELLMNVLRLLHEHRHGDDADDDADDGDVALRRSKPEDAATLALSTPSSMSATLRANLGELTPPLRDYRVCSLSEEVPREWPVFACRYQATDSLEDYEGVMDPLKTVFATLRALLELGRELQSMDAARARAYVEKGTQRTLMNAVPCVEEVVCYKKIADLCSLQDYLDIYDAPIQVDLESEQVWPAEPFLKY